MAVFTIFEATPLSSLMMHPRPKLQILCVIRWHGTVPVLFLVVGKFPFPLKPCSFMGIPAKADFIQLTGTLGGHVRLFSLFQ
jgi:hypothetical protein